MKPRLLWSTLPLPASLWTLTSSCLFWKMWFLWWGIVFGHSVGLWGPPLSLSKMLLYGSSCFGLLYFASQRCFYWVEECYCWSYNSQFSQIYFPWLLSWGRWCCLLLGWICAPHDYCCSCWSSICGLISLGPHGNFFGSITMFYSY